MALEDKNILITPNTDTANEPKIEFTGADASGSDTITLSASYDGNVSTLSFEASTGQLFSVANIDSDGDGYSFSINDNSGIPAVLVELDGTIQLNPNTGNVLIGTATDDGQNVLQVSGNTKLTGDVSGITDLYIDDQIISTGDTNTYLQFHAADQFRIVTGGTERLEVKNTNPVVLVTGNLRVEGDIQATGTLDTTGQNDLSVSDKRITLNDGEPAAGVNGGTGGELAVSGIFIDRGTLDSASFVFNETKDAWQARINTAFNTPTLADFEADSIGATIVGYGSTTTLKGNLDWSYIQSKPDPVVTVTLTGDVTGSGNTTLTNLASGTISFATTIAANSVALGTDTTGAYVADIVGGNAISISETANNAEGNVVTINHADTSTENSVNNSGNTFIQDITIDTYGHITAIASATTSIGNATITIAGGTDLENTAGAFTTNQTANDTITINHSAISHSVTSGGALTPAYGASFTILDSVQVSNQGHVTDYRTRSVTIPASDNTNTTYDLLIVQTNSNDDNPAIRLAAGGSGSGNDDLTLTGGGAITITRTSSTGLTIEHTDTSSYNSIPTITTGSATGTVITGFDVDVDVYGHVTGVTGTNYNLDNRYIRSFQVEDGDGTEVTINQANEWKFISSASNDGVDLTINWTDVSNGTDADPYDLTFTVANTDKGSAQDIFKTVSTDSDSGFTWVAQGDVVAETNNDTLSLVSGNDLNLHVDATNDAILIKHKDIARTNSSNSASIGYGGNIVAIDSITTNARGHVTAVNTKTFTLPASDNTNTTYSISTEAGDDGVSEKIRLTQANPSNTDDIVLAVAQTGTTDGLDISESGDTITFAHHDTSTLSGAQGTAGIASITVDEMGHVTAVTTATYNNYSHPTYTTRSINTSGVDVLDVFTSDTIGSVTNITTRTLPNASPTTVGVVTAGDQDFGGVKTFKGGSIVINNAAAPSLVLDYTPADNAISAGELLGSILFRGTTSTTTGTGVKIEARAYNEFHTGGDASDAPGELSIWMPRDGQSGFNETFTMNQFEVVANEAGTDVNFRVEAVGYTHNLHVDGNTQKFQVGRMNSILADGNSLLANIVGDVTKKPGLRLYNLQNDTSWDDGDILGQVDFFTEDGDNTTGMIQSINGRTGTNQAQPIGDMVFKTQASAGTNAVDTLKLSAQDGRIESRVPSFYIMNGASADVDVDFKVEAAPDGAASIQANYTEHASRVARWTIAFDSSYSDLQNYIDNGTGLGGPGLVISHTPAITNSFNDKVARLFLNTFMTNDGNFGSPKKDKPIASIDLGASEGLINAFAVRLEAVAAEDWDLSGTTTTTTFNAGSRLEISTPKAGTGDATLVKRLTVHDDATVEVHGTLRASGYDTIENGTGVYLDFDGNGARAALTDGLLILRMASNFSSATITSGNIGPGGSDDFLKDSASFLLRPAWKGLGITGNDDSFAKISVDSCSDSDTAFGIQVFKAAATNQIQSLFNFTPRRYEGDGWRIGNFTSEGDLRNGGITWMGECGSIGREGSKIHFNHDENANALYASNTLTPNTSGMTNHINGTGTFTHVIGNGGIVFGTGWWPRHVTLKDDGYLRMSDNSGNTYYQVTAGGNQRSNYGGATGSYNTWQVGPTAIGDMGTGNHVFGSGGKGTDIGITSRTGRMLFGSNGTNVDMMLDSSSDLHVLGDIIAFSSTLSDQRLKDDVETLDKSLEKILQLRGVSFTWNAGSREGVRDIGVIAQEVETVIPEIVREKKAELIDGLPTKTVDYEKLVAVLIEGMKEQQSQIDELREEIQALKGE